jgi:methylthioribose-1-phosphate isomerase
VTHIRGVRIAPEVEAANPAFDVTPARLITAIITERGVASPPYRDSLACLFSESAVEKVSPGSRRRPARAR